MTVAERLALLGSGGYFLAGLLSGIWKYRGIMRSPAGQAHPYVDILHRAALMYSFACLVVWKFTELSPLADGVELPAVIALVGYFGIAISTYLVHALLEAFMWSLVVAELGGFMVLFYGAGIGLSLW
jgi:hypothetical protein